MAVRFVNRQDELDLLRRLYESGRPQLLILYGRRRVGKTRILTEFLRDRGALLLRPIRHGEHSPLGTL